MKVEEYKTIEEKAAYFKGGERKIFNNMNELFEKLDDSIQSTEGFIFRGCKEAKYKLYNSAQRLYINNELYKQAHIDEIGEHYKGFVLNLLNNLKKWNKGVVSTLLNSMGITQDNDLGYLSYMQHFGIPTPLLDYTFNPYIALFFAIDGLVYTPSDNEIDNYFSIYFTYKEAEQFSAWRHLFKESIKNNKLSYDNIEVNDMMIILPEEAQYKIMNNLNIINQEGLFLYNNHPFNPMEKTYIELINLLKTELEQTKFEELFIQETISGCLNIHKSLIPAIREKLNRLGIYRNFVYPNMNELRLAVTNNGILHSLFGHELVK